MNELNQAVTKAILEAERHLKECVALWEKVLLAEQAIVDSQDPGFTELEKEIARDGVQRAIRRVKQLSMQEENDRSDAAHPVSSWHDSSSFSSIPQERTGGIFFGDGNGIFEGSGSAIERWGYGHQEAEGLRRLFSVKDAEETQRNWKDAQEERDEKARVLYRLLNDADYFQVISIADPKAPWVALVQKVRWGRDHIDCAWAKDVQAIYKRAQTL